MNQLIGDHEVWVVKVGSSLVTADGEGLNHALIQAWTKDIAELHSKGIRIVLVSSGAVVEGMVRLGLSQRPRSVAMLQAAAAVGQMGLVQCYQQCFDRHALGTAQVLLTRSDLRSRNRYLNARNTLTNLLNLGVVPVVNENDTVVTDEIRFGDNDTLAALVANLIDAKRLVIMTDQAGIFDQNPRISADAKLIGEVDAFDPLLDIVAGDGGALGRGGMISKVQAARIASRSGSETIICSGSEEGVLLRLYLGDSVGTRVEADRPALGARKQWLASLPVLGRFSLDQGAVRALLHQGKSLLAVGISAVEGNFSQGALVSCQDIEGKEIARGLTNYSSAEMKRIKGKNSQDIETELGYLVDEEVIHRDDLLMI